MGQNAHGECLLKLRALAYLVKFPEDGIALYLCERDQVLVYQERDQPFVRLGYTVPLTPRFEAFAKVFLKTVQKVFALNSFHLFKLGFGMGESG